MIQCHGLQLQPEEAEETDESLTVFELDYPQMIEDKMERINKAGLTSATIGVPCNLADKAWKNKLLAHGYDKDKKAHHEA